MTNMQQVHTQFLTKKDIEKLYPLVNCAGDWQINVNSFELVDKIIALWFEVNHGITFYSDPNYDIMEASVTKEGEIEFKYIMISVKEK